MYAIKNWFHQKPNPNKNGRLCKIIKESNLDLFEILND